jgi:hypothetical protein
MQKETNKVSEKYTTTSNPFGVVTIRICEHQAKRADPSHTSLEMEIGVKHKINALHNSIQDYKRHFVEVPSTGNINIYFLFPDLSLGAPDDLSV